jgi:hypothetical protein
MISLKKYFDAIYCINLEKREDRWTETINELEKWGVANEVTRFNAIDGSKLDSDYVNSTPINHGELGILLSNKEIIEEAVKLDYSHHVNQNGIVKIKVKCMNTMRT